MFEEFECILTPDEVCELLHIGKNRLYYLLNEGILKGYREGNRWRISKNALIEYVTRRSNL